MKNRWILCLFLLINSGIYAQVEEYDTSMIVSITIFNKKDKKSSEFPNVFPDVSKMNFITGNDTLSCLYSFPFIYLKKNDLNELAGKKMIYLEFVYDRIVGQIPHRYLLSVPIRFPISFPGPKFLLIEMHGKKKFFAMQKWGSTIYTGDAAKVRVLY
jgi:hypothetical protein